jgi:hypothetical protein
MPLQQRTGTYCLYSVLLYKRPPASVYEQAEQGRQRQTARWRAPCHVLPKQPGGWKEFVTSAWLLCKGEETVCRQRSARWRATSTCLSQVASKSNRCSQQILRCLRSSGICRQCEERERAARRGSFATCTRTGLGLIARTPPFDSIAPLDKDGRERGRSITRRPNLASQPRQGEY